MMIISRTHSLALNIEISQLKRWLMLVFIKLPVVLSRWSLKLMRKDAKAHTN